MNDIYSYTLYNYDSLPHVTYQLEQPTPLILLPGHIVEEHLYLAREAQNCSAPSPRAGSSAKHSTTSKLGDSIPLTHDLRFYVFPLVFL